MPFRNVHDLPPSVRHTLPSRAQAIYLRAFNNAWDKYASAARRMKGDTREATAHKVAWSAVKRQYIRVKPGEWKYKQEVIRG